MSVEESGRGPVLRRPTISVPVALVAGSLAIPILCMGIPLVLGAKLRERFFVSKSVMENRIREEAAVLQAKHNIEIKELISCLEKEIQFGNRNHERIFNVEVENMSLKTIEIILTRKADEFKDIIVHEKHLRDQMQNDLLSKLQLLQSENQEIKAAEKSLLEEVVELKRSIFNENLIKDEKEKMFNKLNENFSRQLETEKYKSKVAQWELTKKEERLCHETSLRAEKEAELEKVLHNYQEAIKASKKAADYAILLREQNLAAESELIKNVNELKEHITMEKRLRDEKEHEIQNLHALVQKAQQTNDQASELISHLQNENKLLKEKKYEARKIKNVANRKVIVPTGWGTDVICESSEEEQKEEKQEKEAAIWEEEEEAPISEEEEEATTSEEEAHEAGLLSLEPTIQNTVTCLEPTDQVTLTNMIVPTGWNIEPAKEEEEIWKRRGVLMQNKFVCNKFFRGTLVNILSGMELYENVFTMAEQNEILSCVYQLQDMGKKGQLRGRAYSEPRYGGKGRVTLQFGCNYNYTKDKVTGNPLGVFRNVTAEPLPSLFITMIKRLMRWNILPSAVTPDSCIVNIYKQGDCFPPHQDSTDFERPFCTISFMSKCHMVFGTNVTVTGPGQFEGSFRLPLPLGSMLVLAGPSADVAKHAVPAVPNNRLDFSPSEDIDHFPQDEEIEVADWF